MTLTANISTEPNYVDYHEFVSAGNTSLVFAEGTDLSTVQFERNGNTLKIYYGNNQTFELRNVNFLGTTDTLINNMFVVGQEDEETPLKTISEDYHIYYTITGNFDKPEADIYNYRLTVPTGDITLENLSDKDMIVASEGAGVNAIKDGDDLLINYTYLGNKSIRITNYDFAKTQETDIDTVRINGTDYQLKDILVAEYILDNNTAHTPLPIYKEAIIIDCDTAKLEGYKTTDKIIFNYEDDAVVEYKYKNESLEITYGDKKVTIQDSAWANQVPVYIKNGNNIIVDDISEKALNIIIPRVNYDGFPNGAVFDARELEGLGFSQFKLNTGDDNWIANITGSDKTDLIYPDCSIGWRDSYIFGGDGADKIYLNGEGRFKVFVGKKGTGDNDYYRIQEEADTIDNKANEIYFLTDSNGKFRDDSLYCTTSNDILHFEDFYARNINLHFPAWSQMVLYHMSGWWVYYQTIDVKNDNGEMCGSVTIYKKSSSSDSVQKFIAKNPQGILTEYDIWGGKSHDISNTTDGDALTINSDGRLYSCVNFTTSNFNYNNLIFTKVDDNNEYAGDTLQITGFNGDKVLTITNFDFDNPGINVNYIRMNYNTAAQKKISDYYTINYSLTDGGNYDFSNCKYKMNLSLESGSVEFTGLGSKNTLTVGGFRSAILNMAYDLAGNTLTISGYDGGNCIVLNNFDFSSISKNISAIILKDDYGTMTRNIAEELKIDVNLNGGEYDASAVAYRQFIKGSGTVVNANENTSIFIGNDTEYETVCNGNDITITNGSTNVTVKDYFNNDGSIAYTGKFYINNGTNRYVTLDNINHSNTNYFKGTDSKDVVTLTSGLTTDVDIENLSQDTQDKVVKNDETQKYTYISDFDNTTIINLDAYAQGKGNNDTITGSAGNDYINGGSGNDTLSGAEGNDILIAGGGSDYLKGGKGNDILFLEGGNNIVEINNEDDGYEELIIGSSSSDTIWLKEYSSDNLSFRLQEEIVGNNTYESLLITTNKEGYNNGTIIIRNYLNSESRIDKIVTSDYSEDAPLSIKSKFFVSCEVSNGETFDKSQTIYKNAELNITLAEGLTSATILNISKADNIVMDGDITLSRVYDGTDTNNNKLVISNGTQTINVIDFNYDGNHSFTINGNSIATMPINVTASKNYTGTSYKEIIKVAGVIEVEYDPTKDKLLFENETTYTQTGIRKFEITDGNNTAKIVQDTNLNTITPASIGTFNNSTEDNLSQKTLYLTGVSNFEPGDDFKFKNVNITGTNGEDSYIGTGNRDIINGSSGDDDISNNGGSSIIYTGTGNDDIYLTGGKCEVHINGAGMKTIYGDNSSVGHDYLLSTGSAKFINYSSNDTIHFATFDFSKIEFARGEGENKNDLLIKSRVENDNDAIVISNYFTLAEDERISSFNVQGVEYTLQWHESNVEGVSGAMYNVITNDNLNFADGIRNYISGENGTGTEGSGIEIKGRDEFDMLIGTTHDDTITAGISGGELYGNAGKDKLYSGAGSDFISGGSGNDEIYLGNNDYDNDTVSFINITEDNPLEFGKDTVYNADYYDTLKFVHDKGEGSEPRYIGYKVSEVTFEKSGRALIIKAGTNEVKLPNYFDKNGKIKYDTVGKVVLLNGNNEPSTYYIDALMPKNKLNLSEYSLSDLTFIRDITGKNADDLVIKQGDTVIKTLTNFFKQKKPVDLVVLENDILSIKDQIDIQVITDGKNYTGTEYNERIVSSSANETYKLNTGENEIVLSGDFGQDVIKLSNNEDLTLTFDDIEKVERIVSGNDVILKYKETENQVTIKDFAVKDFKGSHVTVQSTVGDDDYYSSYWLEYASYDPKVVDNKVTGTKLDEIYLSTSANEKINLKTGDDMVFYEATDDGNGGLIGWGEDKITLNKNETMDVEIAENVKVTKNNVEYIYDVQNKYLTKGKDLIIVSTAVCKTNPPEGYASKYALGKITLINGLNIGSSTSIYVNDMDLSSYYIDYEEGKYLTPLQYNENNITKEGTITGTQLSDGVDLTNYVSEKGKGVTINTKGGEDYVKGSKYNDTIKSMSGDNRIEEYAGNNKITTGSGDDQIVADGTSSNTINAGSGRNWAWLVSSGTNKYTSGKETDIITVTNGNNTIKAGGGSNLIKLQGGKNNVTTGKDRDEIVISDPHSTGAQSINVIKTGSGSDTISIDAMSENTINAGDGGKNSYGKTIGNKIILNNGINTVTSGKNADNISISGGQNIINSGAGNDIFNITGGTSIVNGNKGNDIYNVDITTFTGDLTIKDTEGKNTLNLGKTNNERVNLFFDVSLNKKGKAVYSEMKFSTDTTIGVDGFDSLVGVGVANKKVITTLEYGDADNNTYNSFKIKSAEIDKLAADIASWLKSKPAYSSTDDVYESGNANDIAKLTSAYTNFAENGYVFDKTNSLMN